MAGVWAIRLVWLLVLVAAGACSPAAQQLMSDALVNRPLSQADRQGRGTRILAVPVYRSERSCCGLAALWMVLDYWRETGGRARQEWLARRRCPDQGYSVGQLAAMARARGLRALVYQGRPSDLSRQVAATRPVIVLLRRLGRNHFVVVVGTATGGRLVVNDPGRGMVFLRRTDLLKQWEALGRPTLLLVPAKPTSSHQGGGS